MQRVMKNSSSNLSASEHWLDLQPIDITTSVKNICNCEFKRIIDVVLRTENPGSQRVLLSVAKPLVSGKAAYKQFTALCGK